MENIIPAFEIKLKFTVDGKKNIDRDELHAIITGYINDMFYRIDLNEHLKMGYVAYNEIEVLI